MSPQHLYFIPLQAHTGKFFIYIQKPVTLTAEATTNIALKLFVSFPASDINRGAGGFDDCHREKAVPD
jgi:hypothetical protein